MKFPYLDQWNNADCVVFISSEKPSENGDFPAIKIYEGRCNFSEKTRVVRNANGEYVKIASALYIKGDIAPELASFTGKVVIKCGGMVKDREMLIETIDRPRNPDGSVHHTRLGLI